MDFCIIIPAHNEQDFLGSTIDSLIGQTHLPKKLIIVNDNSTDATETVVNFYLEKYPWIELLTIQSSDVHLPGTKIVNAFYQGFEKLDTDYDIICKFDADLIFPPNYLEKLNTHFSNNPKLGMGAGFCYIDVFGEWKLENLTNKDHIRGALKAYRKACFIEIGGLKKSMGWDTIDELLAQYHGWEIKTDDSLKVKHLKPTGQSYNQSAKYLQGRAMYKMRYGLVLTAITGLKMSLKKNKAGLVSDYIRGYHLAKKEKVEFLVSEDEGRFIRNLRWIGIKNKLT